jgi:hypothetical protein
VAGRRRSAAEQVGVPELDEQEALEEQELEARLAAEQREQEPPTEVDPYEWVPDKFKKNPEKLAEAYANLEREFQRRASSDAETSRRLQELEQQLAQASQRPAAADDDWRDQLEQAYETDPIGTMQYLAAQASEATVSNALGRQARASAPQDQVQNELYARSVNEMMAQTYDDWRDISPEIQQRLQQDPSLLPDDALGSLDSVRHHLSTIYKSVKYDRMMEEQQELRERAGEQATSAVARKREAQTLSGASGRAPEPSEGKKELESMRQALAGSSYSLHRALERR